MRSFDATWRRALQADVAYRRRVLGQVALIVFMSVLLQAVWAGLPKMATLDAISATCRLCVGEPIVPMEAELNDWVALPGIGRKTAEAIQAYVQSGQPLESLQDLTRVKGIGPKTRDRIAPFIRFESEVDNSSDFVISR